MLETNNDFKSEPKAINSVHSKRRIVEKQQYKTCWYPTRCSMLVPEIVLILLEEQANTISKVKLSKIGFRVFVYGFGFKKFISKEEINIHKLI